jgi:hypothetical protein
MISLSNKTYLTQLQFSISNGSKNGFIRFWINWELNRAIINKNAKKEGRIFINPEVSCGFAAITSIEIDKESGDKFYKYFIEKGDRWKFGTDDDGKRVDLTTQCDSNDLTGRWNLVITNDPYKVSLKKN